MAKKKSKKTQTPDSKWRTVATLSSEVSSEGDEVYGSDEIDDTVGDFMIGMANKSNDVSEDAVDDESNSEEVSEAVDDESNSEEVETSSSIVEDEASESWDLNLEKIDRGEKIDRKVFEESAVFADSNKVEVPESFTDMALSRAVQRGIRGCGFTRPTPVQAACIPYGLAGRDLCANAPTGSGKTAAFLVPLLERLVQGGRRARAIRGVILAPTRELAAQIFEVAQKLGEFADVRIQLAVGGESTLEASRKLALQPDVVVGTPGRVVDAARNYAGVSFSSVELVVLDEGDRLMELGFADTVQELLDMLPRTRQSMLFSATMSEDVERLQQLSLTRPVRVAVDRSTRVAPGITQEFVRVPPELEPSREAMLLALIRETYKRRVLVFTGSKRSTMRLAAVLRACGVKAAALHASMMPGDRARELQLFSSRKTDVLVATDVVARGIDIPSVAAVVNYRMPHNLTRYIHRAGRTARWGHVGVSVSFASPGDRPLVEEIAREASAKSSGVSTREMASKSVRRAQKAIDAAADEIRQILLIGATEHKLALAERDAQTAENRIKHAAEIRSRPRRTWFLSEGQKRVVREAERAEAIGAEPKTPEAAEAVKAGGVRALARYTEKLRKSSKFKKKKAPLPSGYDAKSFSSMRQQVRQVKKQSRLDGERPAAAIKPSKQPKRPKNTPIPKIVPKESKKRYATKGSFKSKKKHKRH